MKRVGRLILLVITSSLGGCFLLLPKDDRVRGHGAWMDAPDTIWLRAPSREGGFTFVRTGSSPDETIAFAMWPELVEIAAGKGYLEERITWQAEAIEANPRYRDVSNTTRTYVDPIEKNPCIEYVFNYEDMEATKRFDTEGSMQLDVIGTLCVHPQDDTLLINRNASRRYYRAYPNSAWPDIGRSLIARIYLDLIKPIEFQ